jgi:hybrid cluster-associated redox disulfide protein
MLEVKGGRSVDPWQKPGDTVAAIGDMLVADVLARWPQTAPVFLRWRLACVGCSLARFEQIVDVAKEYSLDLARFSEDLRLEIERGGARTKAGASVIRTRAGRRERKNEG